MTKSTYDAVAMGAECSKCVLRSSRVGGPVRPEMHDESIAAVIADYPKTKECEIGRPLTDVGGVEFNNALGSIGVRRTAADLHLAIACCPPDAENGGMDKLLLKWSRDNKKRVAEGKDALPHPIECCRPRLLSELRHQKLVTMGKLSYAAVTGHSRSVMEIRGGPVSGGYLDDGRFLTVGKETSEETKRLISVPLQVLPTISPGMVARARRWSEAYRADLSRAFRWFTAGLNWKEPTIHLNPSVDFIRHFLTTNEWLVHDFETTFQDPLISTMKSLGLSNMDEAISIHFKSIEGPNGRLVDSPYYSFAEIQEIKELCRQFYANPNILKLSWNGGYFDELVARRQFNIGCIVNQQDGILYHRSVASELPHRLAYVGSVFTDVTSWKADHTAQEASTDRDLGVYGGTDCVVTARAMPALVESVAIRGQQQVVDFDHEIQKICVGLHETGLFVDVERREYEARRLKLLIRKWSIRVKRASARDANDSPLIPFQWKPLVTNPNSVQQIRALLFDTWKVNPATLKPKERFTKLGDESTSDDAIRSIRTSNLSSPRVVRFIDALRKFRKYAKEYGTYVRRLVPHTELLSAWDEPETDEEEVEAEIEDTAAARKKHGLILPDGRVHPDYNAHGTAGGRISSSNLNAQNVIKALRGMFTADRRKQKRALIGADADQLELRIITAIAQIQAYLDVFAKGGDPHAMTASLMFPGHFDKMVVKSDEWDKLRNISKSIAYASFYGSGDETVHQLVTSAEDASGKLLYPNLSVREVSRLRRNWLRGIPELEVWWEQTMEEYQSNGYVCDPILHRRRDFLDGEKFNEIVNHPIQCVPGWTRILTKRGYIPIEQLRGDDFVVWTGKRWAKARVLYRGIKELFRVHTKRGMQFVCDADHQGKFIGRNEYEWRKFVDVRQHSRFAIDLAREHEFGESMEKFDAYVAGYWTGDGSATPDGHHAHAISFVVANGEGSRAGDEMEAKLRAWAEQRGLGMTKHSQVGCFNLRTYKGATEWLRSIGADPAWKAATKRIPESIWRASLQDRKDFVRGLLDADGYASPDGSVMLNLCQHMLLQDVMTLCRTIGIEGTIYGPYDSDKKGHQNFRLTLNGAQTYASLGLGRECVLRTSQVGLTPHFEAKRVRSLLRPTTQSDKVIKSRLKRDTVSPVSPYILNRMGADDLYDHDSAISSSSRRICVPVFTLEVDDGDHQYVAEGIISKNCAGAHIVGYGAMEVVKHIPFHKWGHGTGMVGYVHDAIYVEAPCEHDKFEVPKLSNGKYDEKQREFGWCPIGCTCEANWAARTIEKAMNRSFPELPGVTFTAKAKIGLRWSDV